MHNSNGSFVTKFHDWSIKLRNISFKEVLSHQIKFSAKYLYSKPIISDVSSSESKLLTPRHVLVIVYQKASIKLKLKVPQRQKISHQLLQLSQSDISFYINTLLVCFLLWFFFSGSHLRLITFKSSMLELHGHSSLAPWCCEVLQGHPQTMRAAVLCRGRYVLWKMVLWRQWNLLNVV